MISVQNHQRPLNGSNCWVLLLFVLVFLSCSTSRKKVIEDKAQIVPSERNIPKEDKKEPLDEDVKTLPDTLRPIGQPREVPYKSGIKPDTIVWDDITDEFPPITYGETNEVVFDKKLELKASYNLKLLLPLNSNDSSPPENSRFVHFYAGALLAMKQLDDEGMAISIDVIDTDEGVWEIAEKLDKVLKSQPDVIIGPFDKENLQVIVDTARTLGIPVVSPFYTSTKLTQENPYYIQLKPNLKDHFKKISEYCTQNYSEGEVAILIRPNSLSTSWVDYFQEMAKNQLQNNRNFYFPYVVTSDSMSSGNLAYTRLFSDSKIKALIVPNYSFGDEDFIYASLRKLMAEKKRTVTVIGMPLLFESEKIDFDFYHGLNMKVVMSDFVNTDHKMMGEFRRNYLDAYGHLPSLDAIKGYDLMLYICRNMWRYGKNFQYYLGQQSVELLQSIYKVEKAYSEESLLIDDPYKFDYFENKHLDIIEFSGDNWIKIWK